MIVTLSGTHGTGKSTNAGKCYYLLNKWGLKFSYIRHQDLLDPFGFIVRRAARVLRLEPTELENRKPTRVLWALYILFIYYPILAVGIRLRQFLGYNIVCDRYVYDLIVGFRDHGMSVPLEELVVRLVPHPDISFVLEAPDERILTNRPEHTAEFIRKEKKLYTLVADHFCLNKVSTADPAPVVWTSIMSQIGAVLQRTLPVQEMLVAEKESEQ